MRIAAILGCLLACGGGKDGEKKQRGGGATDETVEKDPLVDADLKISDEPGRSVKVDLPTVPAFEVPAPFPDGSRSVRELRVAGKRLLETEVSVTGFVTWVYDCVDANRSPDRSEAETRKMIEEDPTLCERRKFYVGDTANTPPEDSLWIVEVPRPYTNNELKGEFKGKASRTHPRRCDPEGKPADSICPPHKIGDKVTVTGRFALESPGRERNSDGLVVYKEMTNTTATWKSPKAIPDDVGAAPAPPPPAPDKRKDPEKPIDAKPATQHQVRRSVRDKSIALAREGATALAHLKNADGIRKLQDAVEVWPGHHVAWAQLAGAYAKKKEWKRAADTVERALRLVPDAAMYHLQKGWYLYEALLAKARDEEASRRGLKPEMVAVDPSTVDLSEAERHLATAVRFGPHLWRAHFLLGRVYLAAGRARAAAESFTTSALRGAPEPAPWLQLGELYRSWDFHDHAIRVAEQGMAVVVSDSDKADLAHLAGVALEAKNQDTQAIAKFSRALELRTDHAQAQFMRGQTYWKIRDFAKAKPDLEAVAKPGRIPGFFHQQAVRMLAEMAKK